MQKARTLRKPQDITKNKMLDYRVNLYKNGKFVKARHFINWSGTAVHEMVMIYKREGYTVEW